MWIKSRSELVGHGGKKNSRAQAGKGPAKECGDGGLSLGRRRVVRVERNRLCNLKSQSISNEWPSPVNDRWSRNENAAELSYEAARSGGGF